MHRAWVCLTFSLPHASWLKPLCSNSMGPGTYTGGGTQCWNGSQLNNQSSQCVWCQATSGKEGS